MLLLGWAVAFLIAMCLCCSLQGTCGLAAIWRMDSSGMVLCSMCLRAWTPKVGVSAYAQGVCGLRDSLLRVTAGPMTRFITELVRPDLLRHVGRATVRPIQVRGLCGS